MVTFSTKHRQTLATNMGDRQGSSSGSRFVDRWRNAWRLRIFRDELVISIAVLFVALALLRVFLDYVETRNGIRLPDPLLLFAPIDLTWVTFALIYSGLLLGVVSLCLTPFSLLLFVRASIVLILLRITCLFLLPLEPPADIIPLADPIIQSQLLRPPFTRDLFFAGDASVMVLLALSARWKDIRVILTSLAVSVSVLQLLQHTHYTIDIVAAGAFAYVANGVAKAWTVEEVPGLIARKGNGRPST